MLASPQINKITRKIASSIAFYPVLIAICLTLLAITAMWLEYKPWVVELKPLLKVVLVKSIEDARLLLGTIVASVITLMVFSFSMVMVVLNQASSNLSPRLLPGLITHKDNQVVLGCYLGTICYCLIIILNFQPNAQQFNIPSLGVFVGLILGLICLGLFAFFIHSISMSIQVDTILHHLNKQTRHEIKKSHQPEQDQVPNTNDWHSLNAPTSGYLKCIETGELLQLCEQYDFRISVTKPVGDFLAKHTEYLRTSHELPESLQSKVHQCFLFYTEEKLEDHYLFGFKQISEIAVKALSPALNDPATAMKAIDFIASLLISKVTRFEKSVLMSQRNVARVYLQPVPLNALLASCITPVRIYSANDARVMHHLFVQLVRVESLCVCAQEKDAIRDQLYAIRDVFSQREHVDFDKREMNAAIQSFNKTINNQCELRKIA